MIILIEFTDSQWSKIGWEYFTFISTWWAFTIPISILCNIDKHYYDSMKYISIYGD